MAWFGTHTYRKKITIDSTKVAGTETNFTVPYFVTDTDIRDNIGQADGGDIVFTASDGETQLSHELEDYDDTTGTVEAYVKIPSLSSVSDTIIYIYYGDPIIADQSDPDNAWDANFIIVNHGRIPSAGAINTKTSPQATSLVNMTQGANEITGQIGKAYTVNGTDEQIQFPDDAETQIGPDLTVEVVFRKDGTANGGQFISKMNFATTGWGLWTSSLGVLSMYGKPAAPFYLLKTGTDITDNTWHYCVGMAADQVLSLASDDQSDQFDEPSVASGTVTGVGQTLLLGGNDLGDECECDQSEVRISDVQRSLTWRQTTYESLINYATFSLTGSQHDEASTLAMGDQWWKHHPTPAPLGDYCKNTRYQTGGNTWWNVVDDWDQDTSWDILNEWSQDTAWDIIKDFDQDTSWDIINAWIQNTSWHIMHDYSQDISWHIFPFVIRYIQQFVLNYIRTEFNLAGIDTDFKLCPIQTDFNVSHVLTDDISLKYEDIDMSFSIKKIQTNFALKNPLVSNFAVTRIFNNTRRP